MMKINEVGNIKSSSEVKKRRRIGDGGIFSEFLEAAAHSVSDSAPPSDITATNALSNLLALQEISEYDVERKKLVQRGKNMLDSLEKLREQIILGAVPVQTLQDLDRQLALQKQQFNDPKLIEIIEDIELRVAVELAKLEMAANRRMGD